MAVARTPMADRAKRDTTINVRMTARTRDLIDSAADLLGKTRSEFIIDSARQQATDTLLDQRLFTLDEAAYQDFLNALENPPPPPEKLKRLFKRKPIWSD